MGAFIITRSQYTTDGLQMAQYSNVSPWHQNVCTDCQNANKKHSVEADQLSQANSDAVKSA